jgi:hypothetical protein
MNWGAMKIALRLAIACVGLLLWVGYANSAARLPLSVPVKFGVDKAVEIDATLDRYRNYYINLAIQFKNAEQRAFARVLIGDQTPICRALNDCGETAVFKVTIRARDNVLLEETKTSYGHFAFSASAYHRNILVTPLKPGKYNIRLEVIEFGLAMSKADAAIELSTDARERDLGR